MAAIKKIVITAFVFAATIYSSNSQVTPQAAYTGSTPVSYVRTFDVKVPVNSLSNIFSKPVEEVMQSTTYFDGLGRPIESVAKMASPLQKDMVSAVRYDEF